MSNFNTFNAGFGEVVTDDRTCRKCDYELKGLPSGASCPECGTPIHARKTSRLPSGDNLTDAPIKYLKQLSFSLAMLAMSAILIGLGLTMVRSSSAWTAPAVFSVAALMWILSVWMVTARRPIQDSTVTDKTLDNRLWLLIVRLTQSLWFIASGFAWLHWVATDQAWTNLIGLASVSHVVLVMLSFGASVLVLAYLSSIAEWAGDLSLAGRLRGSGWCVVVGGVIGGLTLTVAPAMGSIKGPVYFVAVLFLLLFLGGVIVAFVSVIQIAGMAVQAISSNIATEARNIRVAERRAREMNETVNRQLEAIPQPSVDQPSAAELDESDAFVQNDPKFRISGHRIEKSESDSTYDLAPEDS
jgi:hypothetical protein